MANEYAFSFKELLKFNRRTLSEKSRTKTANNPTITNWLYPFSSEVKYRRMIREQLGRELKSIVDRTINMKLSGWIEEKKRLDVIKNKIEKDLLSYFIKKGKVEDTDKNINEITEIIQKSIPNEIHNIDSKIIIEDNEIGTFTIDIDTSSEEEIISTDEWVDELNQLVIEQQQKMRELFGESTELPEQSEMWGYVSESADATFEFNTKQWYKSTQGKLGYGFVTDVPWWNTERNIWISENYNLVKALGESYINRVNVIVNTGIQDGKTQTEIKKEIQDIHRKIFGPRLDKRMSRAEFLVRNEIGRLNGLLTKRRFLEAGLLFYIWNTANDERVRGRPRGKYPKAIPSHWEMQGKICRWDDDTLYAEEHERDAKGELIWKKRTYKMPKAIPGQEYLCRCRALIYWKEILKETDKEIESKV